MNNREAAGVVAIFAAAFPNTAVTAATTGVWAQHLSTVAAEDGLAVAQLLVDEIQWFPTIAQFRERHRDLLRNRRLDQAHRALEAPDVPEDVARANVAKLAGMLKEVGSRPVVDPKYQGLPRRGRTPFVAPMCNRDDHRDCGHDASSKVPRGISSAEKRKIMRGEK